MFCISKRVQSEMMLIACNKSTYVYSVTYVDACVPEKWPTRKLNPWLPAPAIWGWTTCHLRAACSPIVKPLSHPSPIPRCLALVDTLAI